jgi:hypothetical protein
VPGNRRAVRIVGAVADASHSSAKPQPGDAEEQSVTEQDRHY